MENFVAFLKYRVWPLLKINNYSSFYSSHAQFGEDMILRHLTDNRVNGFYIDIGAHHPLYYSNTYHFYLKGWRGLNIDALPGSMEEFNILRPRDINIECCLSDHEGQIITFYEFEKSALSTINEQQAKQLISQGEKLQKKASLKTKTLSSILEENELSHQKIDFISLDVEGMDEIILKSLDLDKLQPELILVENHNFKYENYEQDSINKYLLQNQYILVAQTGPSLIFKKEQKITPR